MKRYFKNIYNLVKQDIKSDSRKSSKKDDKKINKVLGFLGILALIAYLAVFGYKISEGALKGLAETGLENYFIIGIVLTSYLIIFTASMRTLMSNKNKDNTEKYIDKLPVSSKQRYIAKNITQIVYSYSSIALILALPLIYYGINQSLGTLYFGRIILAILLLPIIPTIILFAIMTAIKGILDLITKGKTENVVTALSVVLVLYIYYLIYYKSKTLGDGMTFFIDTISNAKDIPLMKLPMAFANFIIGKDVFKNLGIILLSSIGLLAFSTLTVGNLYRVKKGFFGNILEKVNFLKKKQNETLINEEEKLLINKEKNERLAEVKDGAEESTNTNLNKKSLESLNLSGKDFKAKSAAASYIKRELTFFTRNTALAMNTILIPIILPVFMLAVMGFSMAGEFAKTKNSRNEMYLIEVNNLGQLEDIKEKQDKNEEVREEDFKRALASAQSYEFVTKEQLEERNERNKKKEETQVNLSIEAINTKIEKTKDEEEKQMLEGIKENILKVKDDSKSDDPLKDVKLKVSFENLEEKEKEIFKQLEKLKYEGKLRGISKEEKEEQEKDEKLSKYAKYELPTNLVNEYLSTKEIINNSFITVVMNRIKDIRGKAKYTEMPKVAQFLIPAAVTAFIIYAMQMSIYMFSKEKNEIDFLKTIPISFEKQIKYKQMPGIIMETLTLIVYLLIPELIFNFKMYTSIYFFLGIILSVIVITFFNNIEILLDLKNPNFTWKDTTALAKNSINIFTLFVLKAVVFALIGYLGFLLVSKKKILTLEKYTIYASVSFVVLAILIEFVIVKIGTKMFKKLSN